jgi:hypothetical protein
MKSISGVEHVSSGQSRLCRVVADPVALTESAFGPGDVACLAEACAAEARRDFFFFACDLKDFTPTERDQLDRFAKCPA